jgi:hypothetical protein
LEYNVVNFWGKSKVFAKNVEKGVFAMFLGFPTSLGAITLKFFVYFADNLYEDRIMDTPSINARVADLVRNPDAPMPNEWEHSVSSKAASEVKTLDEPAEVQSDKAPHTQDIKLKSGDYLSFSPLAQKILEEADSYDNSEWEKARNERVQRVQQLVKDKKYSMPPEIVDVIAQKIVTMLL